MVSSGSAPKILQTDPLASYLAYKGEIDTAIKETLEGGWYILGQQVSAFEREFCAYIGTAHAIGVASGTDALQLALKACGIGAGDAVITVAHTAVATVAAVELAGAMPVLIDIDPVRFTMDPDKLSTAIGRLRNGRFPAVKARLKAILPVHLYGHPADMEALAAIAREHDLYIIEDCAQSHGAAVQGKNTGTCGHVSAFSFYPTKNLGAFGDGGALLTNDAGIAEKAGIMREYGWRTRYISAVPGMNTRLDEMQAAILRVKLRHLDRDNDRRKAIADEYNARLAGGPLTLPQVSPGARHVYHQYVVRSARRDDFRAFLSDRGIATAIHYPAPVHLQPAYQGRLPVLEGGLSVTESVSKEIVSLPMHPHMSDVEVERVCTAICAWNTDSR